jgi:hypothetical protein
MSLVFVKSEDRTAISGRGNPNKPYRFSNYFTQPMKIPRNSQVAYVGSTFNMNTDGQAQLEPWWVVMGLPELNYPVAMRPESEKVSNWWELMNDFAFEFNQYGMDGNYNSHKTTAELYKGVNQICSTSGACFTQGTDTATGSDIIALEMISRGGLGDTYNLDFNAVNSNPPYSSSGWNGGGGGTYPSGANWNFDLMDTQYEDNMRNIGRASPNNSLRTSGKGNCGAMEVDFATNNSNTRNRVYNAGANYYNTGFTYVSGRLFAGSWASDFYLDPAVDVGTGQLIPQAPFNGGYYSSKLQTATGIRKGVGNLTPSSDPQISNGGGHQYIGHLGSGGYALWSHMNTDYGEAQIRYSEPDFNPNFLSGFTGLYPCSAGLVSIPYRRSFDNDTFVSAEKFLADIDLNNAPDPNIAQGASARYVFGFDIEYQGVGGNADVVIQAKCLDFANGGTLKNSKYINVGSPISVGELSRGRWTGIDGTSRPWGGLDDRYYIQTSNTSPPPPIGAGSNFFSMLFFRFRWETPYQVVIEATLQTEEEGVGLVANTYNPYTDEPYAPAPVPDATNSNTWNPTNGWVRWASMNIGETPANPTGDRHILIPQYLGEMGLGSYSAYGDNIGDIRQLGHATKGFYDIRTGNRWIENQSEESYGSGLYKQPAYDYQFFNNGGLENETLCYIDDLDDTQSTLKLKTILYSELDQFNATTGLAEKVCNVLVNTIQRDEKAETEAFLDVKGFPLYNVGEPQPLLEWGYIFGFTKRDSDQAVYNLNFDPAGQTAIQSLEGELAIQTTNLIFSNHIQITNLPIQSQNGVANSQNKCVYVVNSLCVGNTHDTNSYRFFCDTAPQLLWIDLNNLGDIELNRLEVLITDDENKPQTQMLGATDITLMFRVKPSRDTGYLPNNIQAPPLRVSL